MALPNLSTFDDVSKLYLHWNNLIYDDQYKELIKWDFVNTKGDLVPHILLFFMHFGSDYDEELRSKLEKISSHFASDDKLCISFTLNELCNLHDKCTGAHSSI